MKKEFITYSTTLNFQLNKIEQIRYTLESNLNRLDAFNKANFIFDRELIYELSTFKSEDSKKLIINLLQKEFRFDNRETITNKFNHIISTLFTPIILKQELKGDTEYLKDYLPLELLDLNVTNKHESKECFNFDFTNNTITIKENVLEQIKDDNALYLTNNKQLKCLEIIHNIDREINELKRFYNDKGDGLTNDIYNDINKLFTSPSIYEPKKMNLLNVYFHFLNNIE